jgi:hypothetical protein
MNERHPVSSKKASSFDVSTGEESESAPTHPRQTAQLCHKREDAEYATAPSAVFHLARPISALFALPRSYARSVSVSWPPNPSAR